MTSTADESPVRVEADLPMAGQLARKAWSALERAWRLDPDNFCVSDALTCLSTYGRGSWALVGTLWHWSPAPAPQRRTFWDSTDWGEAACEITLPPETVSAYVPLCLDKPTHRHALGQEAATTSICPTCSGAQFEPRPVAPPPADPLESCVDAEGEGAARAGQSDGGAA
jgi:hypothetical protein